MPKEQGGLPACLAEVNPRGRQTRSSRQSRAGCRPCGTPISRENVSGGDWAGRIQNPSEFGIAIHHAEINGIPLELVINRTHRGSDFREFLDEQEILAGVETRALKQAVSLKSGRLTMTKPVAKPRVKSQIASRKRL